MQNLHQVRFLQRISINGIDFIDQQSPPKVVIQTVKEPIRDTSVSKAQVSGTRSETRVTMSRMRLKIAQRLKEAQNSCAMLTTFNEIDLR